MSRLESPNRKALSTCTLLVFARLLWCLLTVMVSCRMPGRGCWPIWLIRRC